MLVAGKGPRAVHPACAMAVSSVVSAFCGRVRGRCPALSSFSIASMLSTCCLKVHSLSFVVFCNQACDTSLSRKNTGYKLLVNQSA